ncbi:MAG: hypothetical protein ACUVTY_05480 [Armatimonadota bacterium]
MATTADEIRQRARQLRQKLQAVLPAGVFMVHLREGVSAVGGGSLPGQQLPTTLVCLRSARITAQRLAHALRWQEPAVFARIEQDEVVLDPRTVLPNEMGVLVRAVARAVDRCFEEEG